MLQNLHVHFLYAPDDLAALNRILAPNITVSITEAPFAPVSVEAPQAELPPPQTHILIGSQVTQAHLDHCPDLRAVMIPFAGLPPRLRGLLRDHPQITVHNLHHNASMTAEMALALLFAAAKRLIPIHNTFAENDWRPRFEAERNFHFDGKTALILGYGSIGQRIGKALEALGMTVFGVRRRDDPRENVFSVAHLRGLLSKTHVLVLALPDTEQTIGLIGAEELALMPPGGLLVNVGRAASVDQHALYEALKGGHLFGAGMDVWYNYPPDEDSRASFPPADVPFNDLNNMVMSPHRAGGFGGADVEKARRQAFAALLNAAANGEPIPNRVDLDAGY